MTTMYKQFIFEDYSFDAAARTLSLHYSFDGSVPFSEIFRFDFPFTAYEETLLDSACQQLFFMAGVSYYKAYPSKEIFVRKGRLDAESARFFSQTYQRGLGEFFFVNKLSPRTEVVFPTTTERSTFTAGSTNHGLLIGIGGGKDSLVSVELLRKTSKDVATWSVGHRPQLTPLVERIGLPHYWVEREWDRSLLDHNARGALNGHIPISAILACAGTVVAVLSGRRDVVVSNEHSANESTLIYDGVAINHQYSKAQEFEQGFQELLTDTLGTSVRYYSFLRPLSELRIASFFASVGFEKYHDVFSSCNRAFTHDSNHLFWDGTCPKCAFVFLALTPFVPRDQLEALFSGKNLLEDIQLEPVYRQLLGIEGNKPLDCVGEIKESRAAMRLAQQSYPTLNKYHFELPATYDYTKLALHSMPQDMYDQLTRSLADF